MEGEDGEPRRADDHSVLPGDLLRAPAKLENLPLEVYGSVGQLFIAGIVPGLMLTAFLVVTSGISKMKLGAVARASLPWSLVLLLALLIVTYIPTIALWLPNLIWK